MSNFNLSQLSFNAGELAPELYARTDFAKYGSGVKTLKNFIALPAGGAMNRPGKYFTAEVKDSSKRHRKIPFQFSTQQSYSLELGHYTMRVIMDGGIVTEGDKSITNISLLNPVVIVSMSHGYSNDDWVIVSDIVGTTELNGRTFKIGNVTANSFSLYDVDGNPIDGTSYSAYVSGGVANRIYEISTDYSYDDLPDLVYVQSADVMYLVHPDYYPRKLSRTGHTAWTLEVAPFVDGPYKPRDPGDEDIILTPAARSGNNVTITSNLDKFTSDDIGVPFRLGYANPNDPTDIDWGWGKIDQVTDAKTARIDIVEPFGYEYVANPDFDSGIGFWEDHSTSDSTFTYDAGGSKAVLTKGTAGIADMRQELEVTPNETCKLNVDLDQVQGQVRIAVGKTSGASDVLGWQTVTTAGLKTYTVTPPQSTIHITIDDTGSSSGNVSKINEVSLVRQDLSTDEWREGAWSDEKGYPRAVAFYQQRICFAGNKADPQTIQASKTADYEDFGFSSPYKDTDALTYTLDAQEVNAIRWLVRSGRYLMVGTSAASWAVSGGSNSDAMTPTSIYADPQSYYGSAPVQPLVVGSHILYLQRGANRVRSLAYKLEEDGYVGPDVSILSNHLIDGYQIEEWAFASLPHPVVWCIRSDGVLLGLTYMPEQEVWGWHRHETDGFYESVCILRGDTTDTVYFIVRRTINGQTRRYIEYFKPRITNESTYDYFFVDCGATYSGTATTEISGLDHLEGKEVVALADGGVVEGKTVSNGKITLDTAASLVHVGLPYTPDLVPLNIESADQKGTTQGRQKQVSSVAISFVKSRGVEVGTKDTNLDEMKFYDEAYGGNPPPLFTGTKELTVRGGYENEVSVIIRQPYPLPIQISAIVPRYKVK